MTSFPPPPEFWVRPNLQERIAGVQRDVAVMHAVEALRGHSFSRLPREVRRRHALEIMLRSLHRQARVLGIEGVTYADLRRGIEPAEPEPHPALFDPHPTCHICGARSPRHRYDCTA